MPSVHVHVHEVMNLSCINDFFCWKRTFPLLIDKIARVADVFDCHVCEVGAGPGSLTRSLLHAGAKHVSTVEIDGRFMPSLEVHV